MASREVVERTPWTQMLVAEITGRNGGLLPGEELWHNSNAMHRQEWLARIREAERRGEIRLLSKIVEKKYAMYVVVVRLKPRPKRWPWYAAGAAVALGYVVSWALWLNEYGRQTLLILGAGAASWWLLTRINHSGACPGLHCAGCRGHR